MSGFAVQLSHSIQCDGVKPRNKLVLKRIKLRSVAYLPSFTGKKIKRFYSKPEIWFDLLPCGCMDDKKEKMIECCFSLRTLFWKYLID